MSDTRQFPLVQKNVPYVGRPKKINRTANIHEFFFPFVYTIEKICAGRGSPKNKSRLPQRGTGGGGILSICRLVVFFLLLKLFHRY